MLNLKQIYQLFKRLTIKQSKNYSKIKRVSKKFGFDRGLPIDRFYIDKYLDKNLSKSTYQNGLEVGGVQYLEKFKVAKKTALLHPEYLISEGHGDQALVVDLNKKFKNIGDEKFDLIIATNVLNFVEEPHLALNTFQELLVPGGLLIISVSASMPISEFDKNRWGDFWRFSLQGLRLILGKTDMDFEIEYRGNFRATIAFLCGMATEECPEIDLLDLDDEFPITIFAKCKK